MPSWGRLGKPGVEEIWTTATTEPGGTAVLDFTWFLTGSWGLVRGALGTRPFDPMGVWLEVHRMPLPDPAPARFYVDLVDGALALRRVAKTEDGFGPGEAAGLLEPVDVDGGPATWRVVLPLEVGAGFSPPRR